MRIDDLSSPYIDMWKAYSPGVYVEKRSTTTDEWVPASGLTGLEFSVSADEQGAQIGTLGAFGGTEVGTTAVYRGQIPLATLQSQLPEGTYPEGTKVYVQLKKAGEIQYEAFIKEIRRTKYN